MSETITCKKVVLKEIVAGNRGLVTGIALMIPVAFGPREEPGRMVEKHVSTGVVQSRALVHVGGEECTRRDRRQCVIQADLRELIAGSQAQRVTDELIKA